MHHKMLTQHALSCINMMAKRVTLNRHFVMHVEGQRVRSVWSLVRAPPQPHSPVLRWRRVVAEKCLGGIGLQYSSSHPVIGKDHTLCNHLVHLQWLQEACR
jgi:hypothetical protein